MEKRTAHYPLTAIKSLVSAHGITVFTRTALRGIEAMGLSHEQALTVVLKLTGRMLYKSMPTHADTGVWQDVYRAPCPNGRMAYIKLTRREHGPVVIQFKEL